MEGAKKKLLIISPYFPPSNAADMQRIRMSLPFFKKFGWEVEVVTVNQIHSDIIKDSLLCHSIPKDITIHVVEAFPKRWTGKLGVGSIALRSIWFYKKKVDKLLTDQRYNLIYFSTTQFPVCILGAYWKKKFKIPYVIDMQDPWHSDYYEDKPQHEKPPKHWFSYRLNGFLEPIAMQTVDGIISVSTYYIKTLQHRYSNIKNIPCSTITFGAFEKDIQIATSYEIELTSPKFRNDSFNLVYIGRGGYDMHKALKLLFLALRKGLTADPARFKNLLIHFLGTSYAAPGEGRETVVPVAMDCGVDKQVIEQPDRLGFFQSLKTAKNADALLIVGSDDSKYTASKIYPYLLVRKPILAILNSESSAVKILNECNGTQAVTMNTSETEAVSQIAEQLGQWLGGNIMNPILNTQVFEKYSAKEMTRKQCELFDRVVQTYANRETGKALQNRREGQC